MQQSVTADQKYYGTTNGFSAIFNEEMRTLEAFWVKIWGGLLKMG
jgi:hypothetical protein